MKNLAASLAKFQTLVPNIPRESDNPFFKSKYASLEDILPAIKKPLADSGLVIIQIPSGLNKLKTIVIDVATGELLEGEYEMTPAKNDPQGQGSALTYMRRYALVAMLGLNTDEDDDGNAASGPAGQKPTTSGATGTTTPAKPVPPPTTPATAKVPGIAVSKIHKPLIKQ